MIKNLFFLVGTFILIVTFCTFENDPVHVKRGPVLSINFHEQSALSYKITRLK